MVIESVLCAKKNCSCGRTHTCDIENVIIKRNAINLLNDEKVCGKYNKILVVCDINTYKVAGERVLDILKSKAENLLVFESVGFLVPNEENIEILEKNVTKQTQLILGVGSGVINDLCKYVSFKKNLPYIIVATAPSMDGYASKGAAMIIGGMKVTYNAHVPKCIVGDTEILKNAPIEMIKSGYGDIIGKFSCLNDWKLSNLINGEEICDYIYNLTYETALELSKMGKDVILRTDESVEKLMKALVTVGIAMAYMGNSRPASGSEHHLSHYFEVIGLLKNEPYFCHGTDVAYSTYVTELMREKILATEYPKMRKFDRDKWEKNIRRIYLSAAESIIELQKKTGFMYDNKKTVLEEKWNEIKSILAEVPSSSDILKMLNSAELDILDFYDMYGEEKINDAIAFAKDLKDRYTVLWLYSALEI